MSQNDYYKKYYEHAVIQANLRSTICRVYGNAIKILNIATKRTENATKLKKALQNTNKSPPESYFKPTIIQNRTQKIL